MTDTNSDQSISSRGVRERSGGRRTAVQGRPDYLARARAARMAARCWVLLTLPASLVAQSGPTPIGVGAPASLQVSPGEIVTLQVIGLKTVLREPIKASGLPLPTVLEGISVAFRVYGINLPGPPVAAPIYSIEQRPICGDETPTAPDCLLTSITIQVPAFAAIIVPRSVDFTVSENGVAGKPLLADGTRFNIRVLTTCWDRYGACQAVPLVAHADGTLVTADSPARPDEVVVIYATGLGETVPPVQSGQASPAPAPRAGHAFNLQFEFSPNAAPRPPYGNPSALPSRIKEEFIGLTPGQAGLYQINVRIPSTIPAVPPCGGSLPPQWPVRSNLTISISGDVYSGCTFGGAAICVAPRQ